MRRRMPARSAWSLGSALTRRIERTDTRYRRAMPVSVSPRRTRCVVPATATRPPPSVPVARIASADGTATAGMTTRVPLAGRVVLELRVGGLDLAHRQVVARGDGAQPLPAAGHVRQVVHPRAWGSAARSRPATAGPVPSGRRITSGRARRRHQPEILRIEVAHLRHARAGQLRDHVEAGRVRDHDRVVGEGRRRRRR